MTRKADAKPCKETKVRRDLVPNTDYLPEFHRLEMERVWPRVWQVACREEEIPNVGDYVNYEIGHESILIVRSAPGTIKALYNVCPHRGRRLRDDAAGNVSKFYCGYHAWTFDLEGRIISLPERNDWKGCADFRDDDLSMPAVKCDTWAGFVWINMNPDCESLRQFLAPLAEKLDAFEWDQCRIRSYQTLVFPVNWKIALEAFVEAYHVRATHPQLNKYGSLYAPGLEPYYGPGLRHGAHTGHRKPMDHGRERPEWEDVRRYCYDDLMEVYHTLHGIIHENGARAAARLLTEVPEKATRTEVYGYFSRFLREEIIKSGAKYPEKLLTIDGHLSPTHLEATEYQIFPNCSVLPSIEGAFWYRSRPNGDDPNSSLFDVWCLSRYAPGTEPRVQHEFYDNLEAFKGRNPILEQDFSNLIAVQKGVRSRGMKPHRPNPIQESNISNIHRVLHEYIHKKDD